MQLIDDTGANRGVVSFFDALKIAEDAGLDLVEIAPNSVPPVCKILDYGRFRFLEQKKASEARKKQRTIEIKEIKLRPGIDKHDYDVKMKAMHGFFEEGDKVKVTLRFRGREGLMVFVIGTLAVPTQLGIIPLFMVMKQFGWTGTLGAVIVPTLVTAFGVFFMRQYLVDVIPEELIEAARVDGANMIRTFWHVGVPAARPAMAILGLFTFMTAWTDYLWPLLVAPQNPTLQVALSQLQSAKYVDYSIVLAGAVLATIPLLILFVLAGRQLVSGIMAGAVKG